MFKPLYENSVAVTKKYKKNSDDNNGFVIVTISVLPIPNCSAHNLS